MTISALGLNVAIEEVEQAEVIQNGIIVPKTVEQGDLRLGKVVSSGPGSQGNNAWVNTGVAAGDTVVFDKRFAKPFDDAGKKLLILSSSNIVGKVSE